MRVSPCLRASAAGHRARAVRAPGADAVNGPADARVAVLRRHEIGRSHTRHTTAACGSSLLPRATLGASEARFGASGPRSPRADTVDRANCRVASLGRHGQVRRSARGAAVGSGLSNCVRAGLSARAARLGARVPNAPRGNAGDCGRAHCRVAILRTHGVVQRRACRAGADSGNRDFVRARLSATPACFGAGAPHAPSALAVDTGWHSRSRGAAHRVVVTAITVNFAALSADDVSHAGVRDLVAVSLRSVVDRKGGENKSAGSVPALPCAKSNSPCLFSFSPCRYARACVDD
jgi:hypothetical protein